MPIPTFDGEPLFVDGAREQISPPAVRWAPAAMPGVDGLFVQRLGAGPRLLTVRGICSSSLAGGPCPTRLEALQALRQRQRALQDLACRVARYSGADATHYDSCLMRSYALTGDVWFEQAVGGWHACCLAEATIEHLDPGDRS